MNPEETKPARLIMKRLYLILSLATTAQSAAALTRQLEHVESTQPASRSRNRFFRWTASTSPVSG
jgi:hypothetical protein